MAQQELILDKEVISAISDVKARLERRRVELDEKESRLKRWELSLAEKERAIEKEMAAFNQELSKIIVNTKKMG